MDLTELASFNEENMEMWNALNSDQNRVIRLSSPDQTGQFVKVSVVFLQMFMDLVLVRQNHVHHETHNTCG